MNLTYIDEFLPFEPNNSETVDLFRNQNVSINSGDLRRYLSIELAEKTVDKTVKNFKKSTKFAQNQLFVTFSIFVPENVKKHN